MSKFSDHLGLDWTLEFDCFLLDRVEQEANVDLADVSAAGLLAIERDVKALGRVLAVVCSEQIKERGKSTAEFIKQIRKNAITRAREAVMEALADFFPESEWSAMLSSLTKLKEETDKMSELKALTPAFNVLPKELQAQLFREGIEQAGNLQPSPDDRSAPDPDPMPPPPAENLPENATLAPEDSPSEISG